MKDILKRNGLFLIFYVLIVAAALIPVFNYSRTELHISLTRFHSPFADVFFKYITSYGSGIAAGITCLILLFIRIRYTIILLASWAGSGIIVQLLKHFVFPAHDRPVEVFAPDVALNLVKGIEYHHHFSFPSGHAATAMALFGFFAFVSNRQWLKIIFLLCAAIVSYSRVYLSQHFLEDILFGSFLGILALIIFYWYFHHLKMDWADHPVQYYFKKKNDSTQQKTRP
jgi:membrane-associated phospholipid phosphatase